MGFRNLITHLLAPPEPRRSEAKAGKSSAAGPMIAWSNVGQPRWTPRRFETLAEAGFRKNVIAYRCVMQTATAGAAIPWLLYEGDEELDRHPLLNLLRHPNPLQDGMAFLESVYAYLQIAGNAYIEAVRPRDDETPVELYVLRPDRMKVIPGATGLPQGYQYTVNGQVTTWPADPISGTSNILHIKQFNPLDDWYGMAPLEAAQISVDQHNAAGAWNQALLNHGARPSGALVFAPKDGPATLTDDQVHRLREELGQIYQGRDNAGRPLILEGGLDWREMSLSPKDMDWISGRNVAARDIALAFGVPAQLVGIPDAQTYANMAEARMALYEETVLPLVNRVLGGFDHWLTPMYGDDLELDYDPDEVSALAVRRDTQWNKLQGTDFLTINEKRHAVGYGPIEGGDVLDNGNKKPASASAANAWTNPKFNPNHDPDNGQFTFGPGSEGGDDDQPDDNGSEQDQDSVSGKIGRFLQNLVGIGTAYAEEAGSGNIVGTQPATGEDPGPAKAVLNNGEAVINDKGETLLMPSGVSLSDNAALGEKLSLLPSVFTPGISAPTPLLYGINSLPAKETAMIALFAPGQSMDYQRTYSDTPDHINEAYINFGNYNFGVVSAAAGYDLNQALSAAGAVNIFTYAHESAVQLIDYLGSGHSLSDVLDYIGSGNFLKPTGSRFSGPMYNNPANIPWIKQGFSDYNRGLIEGP